MRRGAGFSVLAASIVGVALLIASPAAAYFERTEIGSRGLAMGRAYSAVAEGVSAIYWNPAGLGFLEAPQVAATHFRPFVVRDLALNFAGGAWPTRHGTVHVGWSRLGLSGVTAEDLIYFGGARVWDLGDGRRVSFGANLKVARVSYSGAVAVGEGVAPPDFGAQTEFTGDVGVLVRFSPRLTAGYTLRNLGRPRFDFVPGGTLSIVDLVQEGGVAWRWSPDSIVAVAVIEGTEGDLTPVAGGEVEFYDVFALRIGVGDFQFFGGVGVKADRVQVDAGFATHPTLGITTMMSVSTNVGGGAL